MCLIKETLASEERSAGGDDVDESYQEKCQCHRNCEVEKSFFYASAGAINAAVAATENTTKA